MFNFLAMANNYEERKIDRYEEGEILVSTCEVNDAAQPYETAISHPEYNEGNFIIVEHYDTPEEAQEGHNKWVDTITSDDLPEEIEDVSTAEIAQLVKSFSPDEKKIYKRNVEE